MSEKCLRPKCHRRAHRNWELCNEHYDAFRKERAARGGRKCGLTAPDPVRQHLTALKSRGLGNRRIAELSGVTFQTILRIKRNQSVSVDTAHKILSVRIPATPHEAAADCAKVPVLGSSRRLQALSCMGYSNLALAEMLGVRANKVYMWMNAVQPYIFANKARDVDRVFRALQLLPAPDGQGATRARMRAARRGWSPPLSWDETNIDDPSAVPTLGEEGSFVDIYNDARACGRTDQEIADRLGVKVESVRQRARRREVAA